MDVYRSIDALDPPGREPTDDERAAPIDGWVRLTYAVLGIRLPTKIQPEQKRPTVAALREPLHWHNYAEAWRVKHDKESEQTNS